MTAMHRTVLPPLALAIALCLVTSAESALIIEPAFLKMTLDQKRVSGRFTIRNTGDETLRYRASAVHFTVEGRGGIRPVTPDEHSLAEWIKFNPKEFSMPPKSSRVVRFSIIPRGKLKAREYWGAIQFVPLKGRMVSQEDATGSTLNLEVVSVVLVPIYGLVQGATYEGEITAVEVKQEQDGLYVYGSFRNTGEAILRLFGTCTILDEQDNVVAEHRMRPLVVLPNIDRTVRIKIQEPLESRPYRVRFDTHSMDNRFEIDLMEEKPFAL